MGKIKFGLSGLLVIVGICFACHSGTPDNKATNKKINSAYEGFVVKPSVVDQTISVSGTLKPFEETVLMPEVTGRVVMVNLPEGKPAKQGTLLVKLFDGDLKAQLQKSQAQLDLLEQIQKRQSELVKVEGMSQSDYDQTVLQAHSVRADIEVFKALIRKTEVLAPFDGVIGLRNISVGAEVTPTTPLATIRVLDKLKLDFSVPEKYSSKIKTGMKLKFSVEGDDNKYDAEVMATEEGVDAITRNLNVRAVVNGKATSLMPGAFANVLLQLDENKNALMVPTQAIIPQERNKKLIVAKNGKATFITVKTGIRQASTIEVLKGIEAGDTVVTTGILFIKPGADIKFSKVIN